MRRVAAVWIAGVVGGALAPLSAARAHHGGPRGDEPMSVVTSAIVLAGLALLVAALVVVIVAVLTRKHQGESGSRE